MQNKALNRLLYFTVLGMGPWLLATDVQASNLNLQDKYEQIKAALNDNAYGIPVYIESFDENNTMQGDVYGIIQHPFSELRQALTTAENWCEIAPLHFNIKACTYHTLNDHCQLTFYTGRKFYEPADDVYQLPYHFDLISDDNDYFQTRLSSQDGPMGTKDYRIEAEAIPLDETGSIIHFSYAYRYNFFTKIGMGTYLSTLGRNKVGFTTTSRDADGKPVYVRGTRGIIERNAVRYFFAIQSYLDTGGIQIENRLNARLNHWFDLTEKYPLQLHEMAKDAYLEDKQMERQDQLRLQQQRPDAFTNSKCGYSRLN